MEAVEDASEETAVAEEADDSETLETAEETADIVWEEEERTSKERADEVMDEAMELAPGEEAAEEKRSDEVVTAEETDERSEPASGAVSSLPQPAISRVRRIKKRGCMSYSFESMGGVRVRDEARRVGRTVEIKNDTACMVNAP